MYILIFLCFHSFMTMICSGGNPGTHEERHLGSSSAAHSGETMTVPKEPTAEGTSLIRWRRQNSPAEEEGGGRERSEELAVVVIVEAPGDEEATIVITEPPVARGKRSAMGNTIRRVTAARAVTIDGEVNTIESSLEETDIGVQYSR